MNIMHLIHTPRHSGAEALVKELCLIHKERGFQSALVSFSSPEPAFVEELRLLEERGTELFVPNQPSKKLARVQQIRRAYRDFRPDVVFAHSVLPALYGKLALPLIGRGPKFVTVLHSASNDDFSSPYLRALEYGLSGRAHAVIAVSKEGAASYQRRFSRRSVRLISNGIQLDRFRETAGDLASEPNSRRKTRTTLVQIGRISPVKQQHISIQLTADLVQLGFDVEIQLAGLTEDPDYERTLRQLTKDQDIESRVKFLGGRSDVPQILQAANLYLMPSLQEAHSIAFLEALASGIPILASNIPAFQFANRFDGVRLYDDLESVRQLAIDLLGHPRSTKRPLDDFDIRRTADKYAALAIELVSA